MCYDAAGHTQLTRKLQLPKRFPEWLDEQKRIGVLPTDLLESYFAALPPAPPVAVQEEPEPDDGGELPSPA